MANTTFFNGGVGDPNFVEKVNASVENTAGIGAGNTTFFHGGLGDPNYVDEKDFITKTTDGVSTRTTGYSKDQIDKLLKTYFEQTENLLNYASKILKQIESGHTDGVAPWAGPCVAINVAEDTYFRTVKAKIFEEIIELDKAIIIIEDYKGFLVDVLNSMNMGKNADEVSIQYNRMVASSENIKDLFEKKLSGSLASSDEGVMESFLNIPFKVGKGIVDYLLVDQEKEAHEAAIYVVTMRFEPVLQKIKARMEKLKKYHVRISGDYEAQCDAIEKLFLQYKKDNKCLVRKIDSKSKESSKANEYINELVNSGTIIEGISVAASGAIGGGAIGSGAIGSGAVAATGTAAGLASLATPLAIVTLVSFVGLNLNKHNQEKYIEKYNYFYREVFEKYQEKIDREKNYIKKYIKEIKDAKKIKADCLDELNKALSDEIQKYAQYNTIYTMIRRL